MPGPPPVDRSLVVATFNVCHGGRGKGTVADIGALVDAASALDADLLALQEIDVPGPVPGRGRRAAGADQVAAVARALGGVSVFAPSFPGGDTGIALVVRGTIDGVARLPLRTRRAPRRGRRVAWPYLHSDRRMAMLARVGLARVGLAPLGRERDGLARVGTGGEHLSVAVAHLAIEERASLDQLRSVTRALGARPRPRLLLGDLNRRTEGVAPITAEAGLVLADDDAPTAPAHRPRIRIDHVAVDGLGLGRVEVIDAGLSDHRALRVTLEVPRGGRAEAGNRH